MVSFLLFLCFLSFFKNRTVFLKNPKNLFCPSQQKICCVSYKTSQEKRSTASEKNWAATIPKKERWEIVLQKISEIQLKKNQKIIIWGDRFLTIKARHGFKARNLMVKQNLGWAPHFLRWKQPKNHRKQKPMWLPVLKPSKNHKSRIRKIYFIYRYRLGNKNSRHFTPIYLPFVKWAKGLFLYVITVTSLSQ